MVVTFFNMVNKGITRVFDLVPVIKTKPEFVFIGKAVILIFDEGLGENRDSF